MLKISHIQRQNAFTLIELSILLVVIGLIIGGVLVGRDLIKTAEIRAQIKQIERIKLATSTFKLKYGYLPADIPPSQTAQLGFFTFTGTYAGKTYIDTPNVYGFGNNNGQIDNGEELVFWQHLSESKLISANYGGSVSAGNYLLTNANNWATAGQPVNSLSNMEDYYLFMPKTKLSSLFNVILLQINLNPDPFYSYFADTSLPNMLLFDATPFQEYSIDKKTDDAIPDTGKAREFGTRGEGTGNPPCVTATSPNAYDPTPETADTIDGGCQIAILW